MVFLLPARGPVTGVSVLVRMSTVLAYGEGERIATGDRPERVRGVHTVSARERWTASRALAPGS